MVFKNGLSPFGYKDGDCMLMNFRSSILQMPG
ncbi:hypothetical protein KPNIH4_28390 [Klebsiella pneumoniae subsp. pneumoniae KPNIH4]|nr:hypothetical protein KPNIH4_28390 [Klebsiella pneumoniae subsp. pneumoniae KPNIH4]